jgi:cell cycle checkpoint protein
MIFKPQSAALKEAIDDLEWPGSSIQIMLQPVPPSVTFKGEGHGDLQVRFVYNLEESTYFIRFVIFFQV